MRDLERGVIVVAAIAGVALVVRLIAKAPVMHAVFFAFGLITVGLAGRWYYRRHRHSLKAVLLFSHLVIWPLCIALAWLMWDVTLLSRYRDSYVAHIGHFVVVFIAALIAFLVYHVRYWKDGHRLFADLASYRSRGVVDSEALFDILSFRGRAIRAQLIMPVAAGLASTTVIGLSVFFNRDVVGLFLFVALGLLLSPYIMAVSIARLVLQARYLGADDLIIVDQ